MNNLKARFIEERAHVPGVTLKGCKNEDWTIDNTKLKKSRDKKLRKLLIYMGQTHMTYTL